MTNKTAVTQWFNGQVKPAYIGIYERQYPMIGVVAGFWDGHSWTREYVIDNEVRPTGSSVYQSIPWRGLADKPWGKL